MSESWTCPFCPLRCDDLLWPAGGPIAAANVRECPLALDAVTRTLGNEAETRRPRVEGHEVDWPSAMDRAAAMLAESPAIVIRGAMPDIATARAAVRLAQRLDGAVMHDETESLAVLRQAIARDGTITATLGEVRRHADVVILLGDVLTALPRFAERFLQPIDAADNSPPVAKQCVWLHTGAGSGGASPAAHSRRVPGREPMGQSDALGQHDAMGQNGPVTPVLPRIDVPSADLERWIAAVRLQIRDAAAKPADDSAAIPLLVALLRQAAYVAVVVAPRGIDGGGGEAAARALLGLVDDLNRQRRAVLVAPDPAASFGNVASWMAGFGGPHRWSDGVPRPVDEQELRRLAECPGAVTVRLETVVSVTRAVEQPGAVIRIRRCIAGNVGATGEIVLPTGMPGIDSAGVTMRGDGSVTLPLHRVRPSPRPTAAALLAELGELTCTASR